MVKNKLCRQCVFGLIHADIRRVVTGLRAATGLGHVDKRGGVAAGIAARVGLAAKQGFQRDLEARFLARLPHGGCFDRFTHIHKSARQRPAKRRIFSTNQDDGAIRPIGQLYDRIYRKQRRNGAGHACESIGRA